MTKNSPKTAFFATYTPVIEKYLSEYKVVKVPRVKQIYDFALNELTEDYIKKHVQKYSTNSTEKGKKNVSRRSMVYNEEVEQVFRELYELFNEKFFQYQVMSAALELWMENNMVETKDYPPAKTSDMLFQDKINTNFDTVTVDGFICVLRRFSLKECIDLKTFIDFYNAQTTKSFNLDNYQDLHNHSKALSETLAIIVIYSLIDPETKKNIYTLNDIDKIVNEVSAKFVLTIAHKALELNASTLEKLEINVNELLDILMLPNKILTQHKELHKYIGLTK